MNSFTYGAGAPVLYDHRNVVNSMQSPSTVHVSDATLQWYFRRYLLQKAMSIFKWELPKTWAKNYFLYVLYCWGFIGVVNTDKFGPICQGCTLTGYDVFYQPTRMIITNPLLTGILQPRIGKEGALIKLQPDYGAVMDRINFYADMMALSAETAGTNLLNSKLAYVFAAADKASAESFKKLYDRIASGEPATVVDKKLFDADGTPAWQQFNQNLSQTYIAGDILDDMRKWEQKFDTDFGIPNANTEKRERLITDEVNANNVEVRTWAELALETLQEGVKQTNDLFGLNISVDWRVKPEEMRENGTRNDVNNGTI